MKMSRWSDYEKYVVMLHGINSNVRGARLGYQAFLDFKKVKEALHLISKSNDSYSYDGNIYSRPITSSRAVQILEKIEECKWDDDIRLVAKQINAGMMISPVK
jgi:hypothetical protein|tara:strand:- start:173 stop:481 length:309 start_codon:yes stop_codon:yes gene_type:complete